MATGTSFGNIQSILSGADVQSTICLAEWPQETIVPSEYYTPEQSILTMMKQMNVLRFLLFIMQYKYIYF